MSEDKNMITPGQLEEIMKDTAKKNSRKFWQKPYPVDRANTAAAADVAHVARNLLTFNSYDEVLEYEQEHGCQVGIWLERTDSGYDIEENG